MVRSALRARERQYQVRDQLEAREKSEAERTMLLEAERAARGDAERAGQMKDEFLATLSHELRTPLNAVLGWAQLLQMPSVDEKEMAEGVVIIERNARAQAQIIEDLLDMSRIISGKVRLEVQSLDLASVVQAALETVQPAAFAKELRVRAVLDSAAGPITGDPNRLQQVFWNLLSNAVKFTPKGGRVHVELKRVDSHLEVSVTDNGEGIEPEFLPHVFDRFRQADATTSRAHGGLGLGLAIVRQLVELHGGTISVRSAGQNCGSSFIVSLPLTVVHASHKPKEERRHASAASQTMLHQPKRMAGIKVVIVDDEPDARTLLRRLLEDCNAEVHTAKTADEAVALVQSERPHVLISDIGMPGEDGYGLIRRVRALSADTGGHTPAVALTAYARAEDRVTAIVAGFQHHLSKPVEPNELIAIVASLAGRAAIE
jgi:signal transduction histidine kinase/ActR/RegA family two-component response regulator